MLNLPVSVSDKVLANPLFNRIRESAELYEKLGHSKSLKGYRLSLGNYSVFASCGNATTVDCCLQPFTTSGIYKVRSEQVNDKAV